MSSSRVVAKEQREESIGDPRDMNGIAYLPAAGRIFVTGKYWRNVYEIRLLALADQRLFLR